MKTHQDSADTVIYQLGLEAQALEDFFAKTSAEYYKPAAIPGKAWYAFALESSDQDEQKDQAKKSSIMQRLLDSIIGFIKRILSAIETFFAKFTGSQEKANNDKAEEIRKRRKTIDFANSVIEKLSATVKVTICAIEENNSFTQTLNNNIKADRVVTIPKDWSDALELNRNRQLTVDIEEGIDKLQEALREAEAKDDTARDAGLLKALKGGLSINGSENGDYLKVFATAQETKKKYEQLLEAATKFQNSGAPNDAVSLMQKIGGVLSKQFSMEAKVFMAYTKLNAAVIEVNDTIYAK